MPYSAEHKAATLSKILEVARDLFNRKGFADVTIDEVMTDAGLTHGGFYNHFRSKSDLFAAAVASYQDLDPLSDMHNMGPQQLAHAMIEHYLSDQVLGTTDLQCPLYVLPSDVSRLGNPPRDAYTVLVRRTRDIFVRALSHCPEAAERANVITALLVGAMTLARTVHDTNLQAELRRSAANAAREQLAYQGKGYRGHPLDLSDLQS